MYLIACASVFMVAYLLNILTVSIGYHRSLAHKAVRLHPRLRRALLAGGSWVTGLDAKSWVVMHRLHHEHSDTPLDPHSPVNVGVLGIGREQLKSYKRVVIGLLKNKPELQKYTKDLDFDVHALTKAGLWWLPYAAHAAVGLALGVGFGWLLGVAYYVGMMSHPIQGGLVNAFGHASGGRNFDTRDNSRNNHLVAWAVFGEGFQNNHHAYPASATFSHRRTELDPGYWACALLERVGGCVIDRAHLMPQASYLRRLAGTPAAKAAAEST